jgi:hypothetical protein
MDEWITDPMRIISPPSVGNAKVRAMKKEKQEEERKAREREKREKEQASSMSQVSSKRKRLNEEGDDPLSLLGRPVSQRASSRRASAAIASGSSGAITSQTDGIQTSVSLDEQERLRLTRSQRRKSSRGIVAGTESGSDGTEKKDVVAPSSTVVTTLLPETEIKDRVVTVAAQELDEHEGLDEASLREHEEVTKVKNVHEIELGKYRMVRVQFAVL